MESHHPEAIENSLLSVHEALEILGGKWKIPILLNLACGRKRFTEIKEKINGLSSKVLSKELKQLEEHNLIRREFNNEMNTFYYSVIHTNCGAIEKIIDGLREWGDYHRSNIFQRSIQTYSISQYLQAKQAIESVTSKGARKVSQNSSLTIEI